MSNGLLLVTVFGEGSYQAIYGDMLSVLSIFIFYIFVSFFAAF